MEELSIHATRLTAQNGHTTHLDDRSIVRPSLHCITPYVACLHHCLMVSYPPCVVRWQGGQTTSLEVVCLADTRINDRGNRSTFADNTHVKEKKQAVSDAIDSLLKA